jgi:LuxR family maltose regulon positive regulatory protein
LIVSEVPREPGPTPTELDELLLEAKLSVPGSRPGSVSRAGLVEVARASGCRVVGVTAPAGYGKSTLLAEWARAEERRVASVRPSTWTLR